MRDSTFGCCGGEKSGISLMSEPPWRSAQPLSLMLASPSFHSLILNSPKRPSNHSTCQEK